VVKPRYLGKEFNMSILVVFLSLLFWGWLLGAIGAILGVPLTMIGKRLWEFMNSDLDGPAPKQSIDAVSNTPAPDKQA
ncbi:MAG: AI-2E family transporter, partial [Candidatus Dadabacteria bacterium]|nr:AI-2E family transporter [Candidatus Dadabacteria bacterium]